MLKSIKLNVIKEPLITLTGKEEKRILVFHLRTMDLTDEDKVEFEKIKDNVYSNAELMSYFNKDNSKDNIKQKFDAHIDDQILNFINTKLDFYNKMTEDKANELFKTMWFKDLYSSQMASQNKK
jgi:type I restriction enzyme R subunit